MENNILQAQLADYILACAFKPFDYPVAQEKLQLFTIHSRQEFSKPVIELSQALAKDLAEITEIDAAGSVQELNVNNLSESYLLIYEGTLLKGAKQNRIVNATLLLPPSSKNIIPASCVEQGRWNYSSPKFSKSDYDAPLFLRKCLRSEISNERSLKGNQAKIWREVEYYSTSKHIYSPSNDFDDIYSRSKKTELLFPLGLQLPPSHGILIQSMGEYSMDFMASEVPFSGVLSRLIMGYEFPKKAGNLISLDNPGQTIAKWVLEGTFFAQSSVGIGTDIRINTTLNHISALMVEREVVSISITPQ